jgi:hypothetical protein
MTQSGSSAHKPIPISDTTVPHPRLYTAMSARRMNTTPLLKKKPPTGHTF